MKKNVILIVILIVILTILGFLVSGFAGYIIDYCTVPGPHSFMRLSDAILWLCITTVLSIGCIVAIIINILSIRKKKKKCQIEKK